MVKASFQKPLLYSYIRFSTVDQAKGQSLNRQLNYAKEVAKEKGLELDESLTMRDMGLSAFHQANITRGALGVFLDAIEQGKVPSGSVLVIESLDRISRATPLESQGIMAKIINAGITVITAVDRKEFNKETIKQNPMDLIYIVLVLIRANEESETKSLRVRAALVKQCLDWLEGKRGFRVKCGKAPSWVEWDAETKVFKLKPHEKAIMLRKIALYEKGYGGIKIAEILNKEFGKGTAHHTGANVYKEVKRRTLLGELNVTVGGTEYVLSNYYPSLITKERFDLLIQGSKKRGATKHSQKFVGILAGIGIFKCGTCGKSVGAHVVYRNKCLDEVKSSHKRYGCVEARRNNNCTMKATVQIELIEKAIVLFCQDNVNLKRILLESDNEKSISIEKAKHEARLVALKQQIEKLLNFIIEDQNPAKALLNKIKALESEEEELHDAIQALHNDEVKSRNIHHDEVTERWLHLTKDLRGLSGEERLHIRQLVKDTFKSITLQVDVQLKNEKGLASFIESFGGNIDECIDLTCEFYNGKKRLIRVNKKTGELVKGVSLNAVEG